MSAEKQEETPEMYFPMIESLALGMTSSSQETSEGSGGLGVVLQVIDDGLGVGLGQRGQGHEDLQRGGVDVDHRSDGVRAACCLRELLGAPDPARWMHSRSGGGG